MTRAWHESTHGADANRVLKKAYEMIMATNDPKDFAMLQNSYAYLLNVQHNMRKSIAMEKRIATLETLAKVAVKVEVPRAKSN